jgi:hypothetical protein
MRRLILPLFILFFISLFAVSSYPASDYSSLSISLDRDKYYEVSVDGETKKGYGNIEFRYLESGKHHVKIYELYSYNHNSNNYRKLLYNSSIRFDEGCEVYGYLDSWDKIHFEHRNCEDRHKKKRRHGDHLSDREFREALDVIKNQSFESGKESVAKQVISDYDLDVDQLVDILNQMWFESTKLSLAKYAYDNMEDTRGFYKVYNVFSFSSSVDELAEYIESNKKNSSDW